MHDCAARGFLCEFPLPAELIKSRHSSCCTHFERNSVLNLGRFAESRGETSAQTNWNVKTITVNTILVVFKRTLLFVCVSKSIKVCWWIVVSGLL